MRDLQPHAPCNVRNLMHYRVGAKLLNPPVHEVPFYIFEDEPLLFKHPWAQQARTPHRAFLSQLHANPWRTSDPNLADMLIVPFDVEASYAAGKYGGTSHLDRMKEALAFLRSHDLFKNRPKSFFWMVHFWQMSSWAMNSSGVFPQDGLDVIHDMSLGRFEWYHANYNEYQSMRQQGKQCFDDVPLALQQWE